MAMNNLNKEHEVAVAMVPLQAQGHLNQLLQLSCTLVSTYNLPVYYLVTSSYNHQVRTRANAVSPNDLARIHFHDLATPPDFNNSLNNTCTLLRDPVTSFLREVSSKVRRLIVIHDALMTYNVQDVSLFPNVESYMFSCVSALEIWCNFHAPRMGVPIPLEEDLLKKLPSFDGCYPMEVLQAGGFQAKYMGVRSGDLHNTSSVIEGGSTFIDLIRKITLAQNMKQWAIGPILPNYKKLNGGVNRTDVCLDWLDKQPPKSVLFVSFGTSVTFSDEEIKELAMGLERSNQKFIWVLRDADEGVTVSFRRNKSTRSPVESLPEGFEERVVSSGMGLVVKGWAPQPEILAHPSTGGFMSHCGWNSCLESMTMGVPIVAWPMHTDQPKNAFVVTEILKIGVLVREWKHREEVVRASTIENVVRRLMESEEGETITKRAKELSEAVRKSTEEGGVSRVEMDSFVAHITR